jgi:hypothetical protein
MSKYRSQRRSRENNGPTWRWTVALVGVAAMACAAVSSPEPAATVVIPPASLTASTPVVTVSDRRPPPAVAPDPQCVLAREILELETQIDAERDPVHVAELMVRVAELVEKACDLADASTSPCAEPCRTRRVSRPCLCDAGDPLCSCL